MTSSFTPSLARPPVVERLGDRLLGRARWVFAEQKGPRHAIKRVGGGRIGPRSRVRVRRGGLFNVGRNVVIAGDAEIYVQGRCDVGDNVFMARWFLVSAFERVTIGDRVRIGERVSIHDENHLPWSEGYAVSPVVIESDVWIGAGVTVLPGTTIGRGCVVAAGSIVRGRHPQFSLLAGVPARVVRALAPPPAPLGESLD